MFTILFLALLLAIVAWFRKPIWAWLNAANDPFSNTLDEIAAVEKSAVFGKRDVPPAASKNDPGISGGPKV